MTDRFPGYDVLRKREGVSWNDKTRAVIDARLKIDPASRSFLAPAQWDVLVAVCDRIVPQNRSHPQPVPLAAMIDRTLKRNETEGYRDTRLPPLRDAWQQGLTAIDGEAGIRHGQSFARLQDDARDGVLADIAQGRTRWPHWGDLPPRLFFSSRLLHDIVSVYYAFPVAWSEIGFGGPAGPRGYVRLGIDRRDPWEAAEARPGQEDEARRHNDRMR